MRPAALALAAAALAAALQASALPGARHCALDLLDARSGTTLLRVALPAGHEFVLLYRHSVTLGAVESHYRLRGTHIVQTAEYFDAHGPGMATAAGPGERFERLHDDRGARFALHMDRSVPSLVVRLHEIAAFHLRVGARTIELDGLGARAVALRPTCASSPPGVSAHNAEIVPR